MKDFLLIRHMKVHYANAISSAITVGFPAVTSWLGFMHALERKIKYNDGFVGIVFPSCAVVCHDYRLHSYKYDAEYDTLSVSANPLRKKGEKYEKPPFITDGRIDLDISVVIEVCGINGDNEEKFISSASKYIHMMKFAGGDIVNFHKIDMIYLDDDELAERKMINSLMPGYVQIERRDLLEKEDDDRDDLDIMLDSLKIHCEKVPDDNRWNYSKKRLGWIVPIVVGFKGIQKAGKVENQRDIDLEHQFVEPLLTMGEFKPVYRVGSITEILWKYKVDKSKWLYCCINDY